MTEDQRENLADVCACFRQTFAYVLNRSGAVYEDGGLDDDASEIMRGFIGQLEELIKPGGVDVALWERQLEDVDQD